LMQLRVYRAAEMWSNRGGGRICVCSLRNSDPEGLV
jgi:hypothetical protein